MTGDGPCCGQRSAGAGPRQGGRGQQYAELSRVDPANADATRSVYDPAALNTLLVDLLLESHAQPPAQIVLEVDAIGDPVHR
jgi:hypothetical protein